MEPYRQGGAASSNPAAELEALLHAMRLGDPSSSASHLQPHHHAAISSLLLNQQQQQVLARPPHMIQYQPQALLPTATPDMRPPPPPHMLQYPQQALLPTATPDMPLLPPQPHMLPSPPLVFAAPTAPPDMRMNYFGGEGFPGAGYVSPVGAYIPFGVTSPSFNVPAAPTPSAAPGPSNLSVSAEEYHPISLSTPALLRAGAGRLTRAEVQSRLLQGSMVRDLVLSAESSAHVVHLLAEGEARVLQSVLACVKPDVHNVMKDSVGHDVFLALLRACDGKFDELRDIIDAVCNGEGKLMAAFNEDLGAKALEELIRMMASNRLLCKRLVLRLVRHERLMNESAGHVVLRHCFTKLPYEECPFIIQYARDNIDEMLYSPFGWRYLVECLEWAKGNDLRDVEEIVLTRTSEIAKDKWSYNLLQHILWLGSEQLKARVVERVAADILDLAVDKYGSFVVQSCFLGSPSLLALWLVLDAVLRLGSSELQTLVLGWSSNYVVRNLLEMARNAYPEDTRRLAFRIEGLPAEVRKQRHVKLVLRLIDELFPFHELPPFL